MNLGFLDKSSKVTPLLVQLYDSQKLHGLASDKKPVARTQLTSAVTDLLEMDVSPRETELIADVLIELMRQAEIDLRQALSERLSHMEQVPLRLVLQIANDEIVVADPMLKNSPVLSDLDLVYIIKSKSAEYWRSIAQRKSLNAPVINSLVKTKDSETCILLADNDNVELSQKHFASLTEFAGNTPELAQSLSGREDVPEDLKAEIYALVGKEISQSPTKTEEESAELTSQVEDLVQDLSGSNMFEPSEVMINTAARMQDRQELGVDIMIGVLRRGQFASFVAQFAAFTGQTPDMVARILKQKSGQGLAVSCKAIGIEKYDFVSIFLLTHKMRSNSRMADVTELGRAVEYFNKTNQVKAQEILKSQ